VGGVVVATVAALGITSAEAVLPSAAAAAAASSAVDPRSVPVLPAAPVAPMAAKPAPKADFTPLAKAGESHFDPKRSKIISRSMYAEEYLNPDGTHSVRQSTKPLNIKLADGTWTPVNTALTVDNASKRATAARNPLTPSMAGNATDPAVLRVQADGHAVSLGLDRAAPAAAKVAGDGVSYADVAPSTELRKWFGHRPERWDEFQRRYQVELSSNPDGWQPILEAAQRGPVTLLYSAHDTDHNGALVLRDFLARRQDKSATRPRVRAAKAKP